MIRLITVILAFCSIKCASAVRSKTGDALNYCIDSKYHKSEPGPEDVLHNQCSPWKNRSCCIYNTTVNSHLGINYKFNFNHCPGRPLSPECNRHFIQDACFYECSPNTGPWVVKVEMKSRKERFFNVPLCESDCLAWYKSCEHDYTCANNWITGFVWLNRTNTCPKGKACTTFKEAFGNAKRFCENVWDGSWEFTPDDKPCMRLWFDGTQGNPNDAVAILRLQELLSNNAQIPRVSYNFILYIFGMLVITFHFNRFYVLLEFYTSINK